jgi:amino acid permease
MSRPLEKALVDPLAGDEEEPLPKLETKDTWNNVYQEVDEETAKEYSLERSKTAPLGFAYTGGTATLKATIFNLINTVIGAGLLALPQAIQQNGIALGCGLIILVALMADFTVSMLLYSADYVKESDFGKITTVLANNTVKFFVDLTIFLLNFGLCASYCIIITDNLVFYAQSAGANVVDHTYDPNSPWQNRSVLLSGVVVLILYPLSTLKKLSALRHVSLLCLIFITCFVIFIVVASTGAVGIPVALNSSQIKYFDISSPMTLLQSVPIIFFAFVCHMNVPLLYGELRRASKAGRSSKWKAKRGKMMCAVHVAIGYCTLLYIAVSIAGYILFGAALSEAQNAGNILNAINTQHLSIAPYVKLVYALLLSLSFPCMSYSGRAALHRLMVGCCPCLENMGDKVRFLEAAIIVGSTAGLAMTGVSVSIAFGLTGSVTCTAIMYIFPGIFHLTVVKRMGRSKSAQGWGIAAITVGFVVMFASTAVIIYGAVSH